MDFGRIIRHRAIQEAFGNVKSELYISESGINPMAKKKGNNKFKRSVEELERKIQLLRSNKMPSKTVKIPRFKGKLKRPTVDKFLINLPTEQPLSEKANEIKVRKEEVRRTYSTLISSKVSSFYITENEEDVVHRK